MNTNPVIVERSLPATPEKAWKALTDKHEMKQWYFDLAEFNPEVGFEFSFMGGDEEGRQYLHLCMVTEVIQNKKLTYSWRYDGFEGISYVTFDLIPEGDNTKLKITHTGLETFPEENPDFAKGNFQEGWNQILNISLKEYLEKNI
ncbi:MAG: SRPBCC domain-containing protein [Saprospiraceae bacterium]